MPRLRPGREARRRSRARPGRLVPEGYARLGQRPYARSSLVGSASPSRPRTERRVQVQAPLAGRRRSRRGDAYASIVLVVAPSSEDEMVLAFLQAEVDSPRFGRSARKAVGDMNLVSNPRLDEPHENARRRTALQRYRGYGSNDWLFRGFPTEAARWERVRLTRDDLGGLLYAKAPEWVLLSRGSRLVADGAEHVGVDAVPRLQRLRRPRRQWDGLHVSWAPRNGKRRSGKPAKVSRPSRRNSERAASTRRRSSSRKAEVRRTSSLRVTHVRQHSYCT